MPIGKAASRRTDPRRAARLLTGVSFAALLASQAVAAQRWTASSSVAAASAAAAAATAGAQQAAAVAAQAQQSMTQTTTAIRGLWTAQAAARAAAAAAALTPANNVTDGLGKGTGTQLPGSCRRSTRADRPKSLDQCWPADADGKQWSDQCDDRSERP